MMPMMICFDDDYNDQYDNDDAVDDNDLDDYHLCDDN